MIRSEPDVDQHLSSSVISGWLQSAASFFFFFWVWPISKRWFKGSSVFSYFWDIISVNQSFHQYLGQEDINSAYSTFHQYAKLLCVTSMLKKSLAAGKKKTWETLSLGVRLWDRKLCLSAAGPHNKSPAVLECWETLTVYCNHPQSYQSPWDKKWTDKLHLKSFFSLSKATLWLSG